MAGKSGKSGGARPGAGRPQKMHSSLSGATRTPLEYMLAIMNDPGADPLRRDRMAIAAAAYTHAKADFGGKKDGQLAAAQKVIKGKFAPSAPPRMATVTDLPRK